MANVWGPCAVVVVVFLAGCSYPRLDFVCTSDTECGADGGGGAGTEVCYGATEGLVRPCFSAPPSGERMFSGTLNTDSPDCLSSIKGAADHCVVAAANISIMGTVPVMGSKALVLVATDTITISGTLDASSRHNFSPPYVTAKVGAGAAEPSQCDAGEFPFDDFVGGGGAGGTFVARGGFGGLGSPGGTFGGTPGAGQTAISLRGGCPGQEGAALLPTQRTAAQGGGAVYLIAEKSINIAGGTINASGEGGHPGERDSAGGGGGGSGGLIGLDSPMIVNTGVVFANGGSGGEGADSTQIGSPGPEPNDESPAPPAVSASKGGTGGPGGGGGTAGGQMLGAPGSSGNGGGGGGGGGGTGVMKVYRGVLQGRHSPVPS